MIRQGLLAAPACPRGQAHPPCRSLTLAPRHPHGSGSGGRVGASLSQREISPYPGLETFSFGPESSPRGDYPILELGFMIFWALWGSKNLHPSLAAAFIHSMIQKREFAEVRDLGERLV